MLSGSVSFAQYPGFDDPGSRAAGPATGGSGNGLVAVEPSIDGGSVQVGATAQVVVLFRNDSGKPVETGLIRLYPSSTVTASVTLNQCEEEPLTPGAECAIALTVKGVQAGSWRVEMLMSHSGRARLVTTTLSGTVETSGEGAKTQANDIEANPDEIDFGSLSQSQTLVESVMLRNSTANPIEIDDIYIDTSPQSGYALKTECDILAAGQACIATVTWAPKLRGPSSGVLVIHHNGPTALTSVPLRGEYTPSAVSQAEVFPEAVPGKGLLVSSQKEIDFGTAIVSTSTITISLVNAGDSPLVINDVRIAGQDNGLSFRGEGCKAGTILQPIDACPLTLSWSPTRVGELLDDVQVVHNGARGVLVLPVRGTADAAVSQDQKSILLTSGTIPGVTVGSGILPLDYDEDSDEFLDPTSGVAGSSVSSGARPGPLPGGVAVGGASDSYGLAAVGNVQSVLDGYKITSFSANRAIINGPSGSRIVFDEEEIVLGGIPWQVHIQKNGIEFMFQGQRVLLLFDRSLSSSGRANAASGNSAGSSGSSSSSSGTSSFTSSSSTGG